MPTKNSHDTNGNQTHNHAACSAVPQPTDLEYEHHRTQAATQYVTITKNLAVIQLGNKSPALYARVTIL
jgi:hypothetical protein